MLSIIIWLLYCFTNLVFAFGLLSVARGLPGGASNIRFAPILIWFIAALFGGPIVALAFWLIHCSTLVPKQPTADDKPTVREQLYEDGLLVYGKQFSEEQACDILNES